MQIPRIAANGRWILAILCCLPFVAGLAMMARTPSELFSMDMRSRPAHAFSMTGDIAFGPAAFAMRCEGSGDVRLIPSLREQMVCIFSGTMNAESVEMIYEFRMVDLDGYIRLRSVTVNGKPSNDPRLTRITGLWVLLPSTPETAQRQSAREIEQNNAEFLRVSDQIFTMDRGPLSNGQAYILHLRRDAWQPVVAAVMAQQQSGPATIDPASVDIRLDMRLDMEKGQMLKQLDFQAQATANVIVVQRDTRMTIPVRTSLKGQFRGIEGQVTVERPQNAVPAEYLYLRYSTLTARDEKTYDGFGNILPSDIALRRGVYPLAAGIYVVVTDKQVILFDAVEGRILSAEPR